MSTMYPTRPHHTGDVVAHRRAMVEYRWCCARADYEIGCAVGAIPPGADARQIIAQLYASYLIADAQEGR